MNPKSEMSRITLDIPKSLHKRIKALAALGGMSMRDYILGGIEKQMDESPIPNKETLKAIKDAKNGIGLIEIGSIEDLIKKYGR